LRSAGKNTLPAFTEACADRRLVRSLRLRSAYPADLASLALALKDLSYDVVVKDSQAQELPEKNAEFAQRVGDYESWKT